MTHVLTLSSPAHAPAYMMAANAGVIKAIVSFYTALIRIDGIRKTEKPYFDN